MPRDVKTIYVVKPKPDPRPLSGTLARGHASFKREVPVLYIGNIAACPVKTYISVISVFNSAVRVPNPKTILLIRHVPLRRGDRLNGIYCRRCAEEIVRCVSLLFRFRWKYNVCLPLRVCVMCVCPDGVIWSCFRGHPHHTLPTPHFRYIMPIGILHYIIICIEYSAPALSN